MAPTLNKPCAQYEITSPGLRWTAFDLRSEAPNNNRKRSTFFCFRFELHTRTKEKTSQGADDIDEDADGNDTQGKSKSSVNFPLVGARYDNGVPVHIYLTGSSVACCFHFTNKETLFICLI